METRMLPITGFEDYWIREDGTVWSNRQGGLKELKTQRHGAGYRIAVLRRHRKKGTSIRLYVHVLVLEAFVGPCPKGMECLHGDGNPSNNALSNLRWGTRVENAGDKILHGTHIEGEDSHLAKLTEGQVREIRALYSIRRLKQKTIAKMYGVSKETVSRVCRRVNWKNVE